MVRYDEILLGGRGGLCAALCGVWERSVRATHDFLSEDAILKIREDVAGALESVPHLVVASDGGEALAFMGASPGRLDMLFVSPDWRGRGVGKTLLLYGIGAYGICETTVNEQNPQAFGFYEHMGFEVYRRMACDGAGRPYPILYMRLRPCLEHLKVKNHQSP